MRYIKFKIKKSDNDEDESKAIKINVDEVINRLIEDYNISPDNKKDLKSLINGEKPNNKLLFLTPARRGVSVNPIFDFFNDNTSIFYDYKKNNIIGSQIKLVELFNLFVQSHDKNKKVVPNPISESSFSKYWTKWKNDPENKKEPLYIDFIIG